MENILGIWLINVNAANDLPVSPEPKRAPRGSAYTYFNKSCRARGVKPTWLDRKGVWVVPETPSLFGFGLDFSINKWSPLVYKVNASWIQIVA